jgi:FKBP-type peptidyl-prolyl cis-trans isomerase (trigger factor)
VERATEDRLRRMLVQQIRAGVPREEAEKTARAGAERSREAAEREIKFACLLRAIADKERIFVEESEVHEQIRAIAARQNWTEQRAERYLEEEDMLRSLREDMREAKTKKFLIDHSKVTEMEPSEFQKRHAARFKGEREGAILRPFA